MEKGTIYVNLGLAIKRKALILQKTQGHKSLREFLIATIEEKWDKYPKPAQGGELNG